LFVRRTEAVSKLLPQPHLRGARQGDFELSNRRLRHARTSVATSPDSRSIDDAERRTVAEQSAQRQLEISLGEPTEGEAGVKKLADRFGPAHEQRRPPALETPLQAPRRGLSP